MKLLVGFSALGLVLAASTSAFAQEAATADPATAQFMCDLTGDCSTAPVAGEPSSATSNEPAGATTGTARRGGTTRGFSFRRGNQPGSAATTPSAVASTQTVVRPAQVGQTNMGLTFVSGSAVLTDAAKVRLARYAAALRMPALASHRLRIEGHTDASGSAASNEALSRARAQAAADFLVQAGIDRSRLDVVGYGSRRLANEANPRDAANRRVMAVLL